MSGASLTHNLPERPGSDVRECPDCGLFQRLPTLRPGFVAECPRCGAVLRRRRRHSFALTFALMLAGLALFAVVMFAPLMSMRFAGRQQGTTLPDLPFAFEQFGMWELTVVVLAFTVLAPLLKLSLTAGVLVGLRAGTQQSLLAAMARVRVWISPWAMTEVFLLGLFVAYTRLSMVATVHVGVALYAMAGLMLVTVAADAWLDEHAMWEAIGRRRRIRGTPGTGQLIACDTCAQVARAHPGDACPRCDSRFRLRKPESIARTWALVLAAATLYIPSNILPVMTLIRLARGHPSTIIGGVEELIAYRMWPLALLVFVASVAVPVVKLILLSYMLVTTHLRSAVRLRQRTRLYRLVDVIGRWSMIDVFMIAILTALVRMGLLASVIPGDGAICFAGVVILTMLAAASFDPRLMWDAAEQGAPAAPALAQART